MSHPMFSHFKMEVVQFFSSAQRRKAHTLNKSSSSWCQSEGLACRVDKNMEDMEDTTNLWEGEEVINSDLGRRNPWWGRRRQEGVNNNIGFTAVASSW